MAQTIASSPAKPRIVGAAYTGDAIRLSGWPSPVVVDLAGLAVPDSIPLLLNHENSTAARVGSARCANDGRTLAIDGEIAATSADALHVAEVGDWQLSIGAEPLEVAEVRAGRRFAANGREFVGPACWVKRARLREVSIVAVGADADSHAAIAAKAAGWNIAPLAAKEPAMPDTIEAAAPDIAALQAEAVAAERERIAHIREVCAGDFSDIEREAISAEWTPEAAAREILRRKNAARPAADPRVAAWSGRQGRTRFSHHDLLANLFVRAGCAELGVQTLGAPAIDAARSRGPVRFVELAHRCLAAEGGFARAADSDENVIRAALSTTLLPNVLNSFVRRNLERAYAEAPSVWRTFCAIRSAPDFRENAAYRLSSMEPLSKVAPGGEVTHGTLSDEPVIRYAVDTFAQVLTLDRRMVVNDDLSAFAEIARLMGVASGRTLDDLVWGTILSNPENHFSGGNGNLLSGVDSALNEISLGRAITQLMCQKDRHGRVIGMDAHVLGSVFNFNWPWPSRGS